MRHFIAGAFVSAGIIASGASAGGRPQDISWFDDLDLWTDAPSIWGGKVYPASWVSEIEPVAIGSTRAGTYPVLSGGAGWNSWSVTSPGGLVATGTAVFTAVDGESLRFDFGARPGTDGSGLHGVGGNFRLLDVAGDPVDGEVRIELSNGSAAVQPFTKGSPFAGFWSTDPMLTIRSMSIKAYGTKSPNFAIGVRDLYLGYAGVAVPAPGALVLLGASGLVGIARRRR